MAAEQGNTGPNNPNVDCGKDALGRFVERTSHTISGLRVSVDRCPDATLTRTATTSGVFALLGGGAAFLLTRSPHTRLVAAVASAALGCFASRYHVSADWDPDRSFAAGGKRY
jgi:hypothetical protein